MSNSVFLKKSKVRMLAVWAAYFLTMVCGAAGCGMTGTQESRTAGQIAQTAAEAAADMEKVQPTEVIMIHNNPCESCDEPARLMELLDRLAPDKGAGSDYEGSVYYAYHGEGYELVEKACEQFGLEKKNIVYPLVIVGERYLMGDAQLEEELTDCLADAATAGANNVLADAGAGNSKEEGGKRELRTISAADAGADTAVHLLYFYTEICDKCEKAEAFFKTLPRTIEIEGTAYPLVITELSVAEEDNALLFAALAEAYQVPESRQQVPFLFAGDEYLSGERAICGQTEQLLAEGKGLGHVYEADMNTALKVQSARRENMPFFLLRTVGVGFLNGFNPCALSLTLLFLSLIAAVPGGFLRYGISFLLGKFLAYVLLGIAASAALSAIPFEAFAEVRYAVNLLLLLVCMLLAAGNLLDCYHAARGELGKIRVQLPGILRRFNHELVKKIVSPAAGKLVLALIFVGSMAIACGEFFCTGQIYLVSILQWIRSGQGSVSVIAFSCTRRLCACPPLSFF